MTTERSDERETFLADIITTACEGGINYWARVNNYSWGTEQGKFTLDGLRHFASATVIDEEGKEYSLTTDVVETAVQKVLDHTLIFRKDIVEAIVMGSHENDAGYIDADAADCLVQAAVLSELVYG